MQVFKGFKSILAGSGLLYQSLPYGTAETSRFKFFNDMKMLGHEVYVFTDFFFFYFNLTLMLLP